MTAVLDSIPTTTPRPSPLKVTQPRVLHSEWTKFRSLRSTIWTLLVAVVLMIGIGALISAITANQFHTFSAHDIATFDPISTSLNGITFAQLAIGVLGVLMVTGEYSTGMIRSSLTAVPKRLPVLWQTLLDSHNLGVSISSPDALRAVFGAALYMTVAGLIGMAIGSLLRNTAAGISTFVGIFFVLPPLAQLLPSSISNHVVQYFPSNAGEALYGGTHDVTNTLSPWTGFAVLCGYAAVLVAAAAWRLRRTDA